MSTKIMERYPEEEVEELREAFRLLDTNGDGAISTEDLRSVMCSLGQFLSVEELKQIIGEIKIDGNSSLTFEEFAETMANISTFNLSCEEEELRQAFGIFDRAGRGYICSSDLRVVLHCMGEDLTEDEIDDMIAEVDIDGDGRIDFEEFIACLREDHHYEKLGLH